jgi:hypothetical protein
MTLTLSLFLCFMKVLEEKEEKIAPGTLLGTTHTYAIFLFYSILFFVFLFITLSILGL